MQYKIIYVHILIYQDTKLEDLLVIGHQYHSVNTINILLMEQISQKAADKFTPEELSKQLSSVHEICLRSKTKLRKDLLTKYAKKLLCIGCFCIGTDQTDIICS